MLDTLTGQDKIDFSQLIRFYKVFGRHYRKYWQILTLAYGSLIATILVSLFEPWPLKLIIDHIILNEPVPDRVAFLNRWISNNVEGTLAGLALSIILIEVLVSTLSYLNKFYVSSAGYYMVADIRERVFAHLQRLSLSFHNTSQSGDIIYRMTSDFEDLKELLIGGPQDLAQRLLTIVSITVLMLWLNWKLALIAFSVVPVMYIFTHRFGADVQKAVKKQKEKESQVASIIAENVTAMTLIQAYGQEEAEKAHFNQQNLASLEYELRTITLSKTFKRVSDMLVAIGTSAVLYFGARFVLAADIPPGTLVLFVAYLKELYGPIDKLSEAVLGFARNLVSGERIMELVENDMVVQDDPNAVPAPVFKGRVEFRDVTFGYKKDMDVLKNLNFVVEPGQTIALVGHSGAGKSTLISLLLRFYDPDEGRILVDGTDIHRYQLKSLRSRMTIVLQEAVLFRKTIRENIAFGKPDATDEEIIRAARLAQAHDFITQLPDGYDTLILEGGTNLSGGQKQRISIARAMIRDSPILILDEPATGLDAEIEAKISAAIRHLTRGKTTFIIAHKFSTVRNADKILLLEDGVLVQQGTHEDLLYTSSEYRELYELQLGSQRAPRHEEQLVVAR